MLNALFTFPVVLIDGENEERKFEQKVRNKELMGDVDDEEEYDIIYGEAEYPYWEFIGIEDRWLPTAESLDKALTGKFEACMVRFVHTGPLLVPWTRKKFKTELEAFVKAYEEANPQETPKKGQLQILTLTAEQYKKETEGDGDEG